MDRVVRLLVRPPRMEYELNKLFGGRDGEFGLRGSMSGTSARTKYFRKDFTLFNSRNIAFEVSHYVPIHAIEATSAGAGADEPPMLPCVIYLHGNAGSRVDANPIVKLLLPMNITVLALDFSGCGRSEGEYISLGHFEQDDVRCAVRYLRSEGRTSLISLWGRSMGAVTAVLYTASDPSVAGCVLDSPFARLPNLMLDLAQRMKINVGGYAVPALPPTLANMAISVIRSSVKKRYDFDIIGLDAENAASECYCPALIGHGSEDDFIEASHSRMILEKWQGDSHLELMEATHNSSRPSAWYTRAATFLSRVLNGGLKDADELFEFDAKTTNDRFPSAAELSSSPKSEAVGRDVPNPLARQVNMARTLDARNDSDGVIMTMASSDSDMDSDVSVDDSSSDTSEYESFVVDVMSPNGRPGDESPETVRSPRVCQKDSVSADYDADDDRDGERHGTGFSSREREASDGTREGAEVRGGDGAVRVSEPR